MTITSPHLTVAVTPIENVLETPVLRPHLRTWSGSAPLRVLPDLAASVVGAVAVSLAAPDAHTAVVVALPVVWLTLMAVCDGYAQVPGTVPPLGTRAVLRAAAGLGLVAWATAAATPAILVATPAADLASASRTVLLVAVLVAALTLTLRYASTVVRPPAPIRVVVAGDPAGVEDVVREIRRAEQRGRVGFEPIGVCVSAGGELSGCELRQWSGLDLLHDAVLAGDARAVIMVPGPHADHHELRRVAARLHDDGISLLVGSGLRDVAPSRLVLGAAGGLGLLHVRPAPLAGPRRRLKHLGDRIAAMTMLTLLSPALLAIAVAIRVDTAGPAIFRQTRVGRDGRTFTMYKFRTMRHDASLLVTALREDNESDRDGVLFKIRRDPRITRIGTMLRRYSLDEVPQLINVARGEMSLVGPRPALPAEVAAYCSDMRRRLVVRPGLTGLWQVSGRSDLPWDETVRLDLQYVDNWSLSLDLLIVVRTARAVLGHRGAY